MAQPQTGTTTSEGEPRFFPVSVESLSGAELEMDLYIRHGARAEPVLFRAVGLRFTEDDRAGLLRNAVEHLYVRMDQHRLYRKMLNGRLESVFLDTEVEATERARFVRSACSRMIEDIFDLPGNTDAVESVVDVSKQLTSWSDSDPHTFGYLLDMSAHDYLTLTHMVNVGVGCGMLVKELHPDDSDLMATAIQGGLLHDIGKRGLPAELLNKEGRLSPQEWEQLQRHPQIGYDELKSNAGVPQVVLDMTRDHHERLDGRGYPRGVGGGLIGFSARVCAVVDVFDALSASRPYRGAIHPLEVLKIMADGARSSTATSSPSGAGSSGGCSRKTRGGRPSRLFPRRPGAGWTLSLRRSGSRREARVPPPRWSSARRSGVASSASAAPRGFRRPSCIRASPAP